METYCAFFGQIVPAPWHACYFALIGWAELQKKNKRTKIFV